MTAFERAVVHAGLQHIGAPYVYRGKGLQRWTPQGLELHPWGGLYVFDCSGLVTYCLQHAGGPDWLASHSAETMFDSLPPAVDSWGFAALRFYRSVTKVDHVAFSLGNGLVLEAAGGDRTTLSPMDAARRPLARVRVCFESRTDFAGARLLPVPKPAAA